MIKYNRIINLVLNPKTIAGIIISFGGVYWAFRDFQFQNFKISLYDVNYLYILFATLFLWSSVWLRAVRWKYIFNIENTPTIASLYRAEMMGYFGNNVLPLRLGELMRSYIIGKEWQLPKTYVFGTVVLERMMDAIVLVLLSFFLILIYPLEESLIYNIIKGGVLTFMIIFISLILLHRFKTIKSKYNIINRLNQIINDLLSINKRNILPLILTSFIIWGIYLFDVYLLQCAFEFNLSFSQVLMILVFSSMALAIPSAPGMVGTYHAAVKYTIVDLIGYTPSDGISFAIIMHAYGYILLTLIGAYFILKNQIYDYTLKTIIDNE